MTPILQTAGLSRSFGGFRAVADVDLSIAAGSIHALIGPNGAGKTTLFSLLAGFIKPTAGRIRFAGEDVAGLSPDALARRGVVCGFQITHVFKRLSVLDNLRCAVLARRRGHAAFWRIPGAAVRQEAVALAEELGLAPLLGQPAGTLSHGDQRVLEVGLALATRPRLLLLDEPTAGMSPMETTQTVDLVRRLAASRGLTVLLVEHDMKVVFAVSDRVTVLHEGRVLREGTPAEIRTDPAVVDVYLGSPL